MVLFPLIRYAGELIRVTPDTAADLVGKGEAVLVEGELTTPPLPVSPPAEPDDEPTDDTPKRSHKKKAL